MYTSASYLVNINLFMDFIIFNRKGRFLGKSRNATGMRCNSGP